MIIAREVETTRFQVLDGMLDTLFIHALYVIKNPLVRVREAYNHGELAESLDRAPLIDVSVLELINDNDGVGVAVEQPNRVACLKQARRRGGELIENKSALLQRQAFRLLFPIALEVCFQQRFPIRRDEGRDFASQHTAMTSHHVQKERMECSNFQPVAILRTKDPKHSI